MSAQIPVRRTRQAVRSTADENASRTVRGAKSKLPSNSAVPTPINGDVEKPTKPVLGKADASVLAAKRKREALGEVTNKNKNIDSKASGNVKGDPHELKKDHAKASSTGPRVALQNRSTFPSSRLQSRPDPNSNKDVDDGMALDPSQDRPIRASRRISTRTTTTSSNITAPRAGPTISTIGRRIAPTTSSKVAPKASSASLRSRPMQPRKPLGQVDSNRSTGSVDVDERPAQKKRRTSSIEPTEVFSDAQSAVEEQVTIIQGGPDDRPRTILRLEDKLVSGVSIAADADWDDLDQEDADDPLMVSEYVNEIFPYLLKIELTTMPNPRYMDTQAELAWRMRGILTDWLIQIHGRFRLLPETLFLTINVIDRFLSARVVSLVKLQLVGITALFISAKYEEIMAPSVANFLASADGNYEEKDILEAEKYILRTLDWNLSYPNPIHFLRRSSKADGYDLAVRTVAKYFIEVSCLENRLLEATPSLVAAAGMWLARLVLDKEEWTPNLVHYSGYTESEIIPVARLTLNYLLKPTRHENFFKKYAARKFMKASPFVHMWARDRWAEGTSIDLAGELPELRKAAQARRDAGQAAGQLAEEEGVLVHP